MDPNTPEEAVKTFFNGMINGDSEQMLSVSGTINGDALNDDVYETVKAQMDASAEQDSIEIVSVKVLNVKSDGKVALCTIEFTLRDNTVFQDEGTVVMGRDSVWRLPFFE